MTLAQADRLRWIINDLAKVKDSPSQVMRENMKPYSQEDVYKASEYIQKIIERDDGCEAFQIIGAYNTAGPMMVMKKVKELDI